MSAPPIRSSPSITSSSSSGARSSTGSSTAIAPVRCTDETYVSATRCAVWSQKLQRARSRTAHTPITGSDRTAVPLALPVAHSLAPGLELPAARDRVVVAKGLTEGRAQARVSLECRHRALKRAGERRQVLVVGGVALHGRRRLCAAPHAVGRRGHQGGE